MPAVLLVFILKSVKSVTLLSAIVKNKTEKIYEVIDGKINTL